MFSTEDTIVAIATPPGRGGRGVVRVSGPLARTIATLDRRNPLALRHATLVRLRIEGLATDRVVATFFPRPHSYISDDVVEINAHGSPVLLGEIVRAAIAASARLAEPGEFTLHAFLNGRLDLIQAEAVADLVDAVTPEEARAAFDQLEGTLSGAIGAAEQELFDLSARLEASLDFPEEGSHFIEAGRAADINAALSRLDTLLADSRRGRAVREGRQGAISSRPNAGKSSLFNILLVRSRLGGTTAGRFHRNFRFVEFRACPARRWNG